jgi:uncharacterized protein YyaL (SSP411 family)
VNLLSGETSPYLLQHKDNPVHWWPWGQDAFDTARERDVPVLLSVGYSACHWCHVMAHESFEHPETAALMNELYVSIKVDREERPDVDALYMDAVVSLTGAGGWPMTVFLTPDGEPFYGGTYYPPRPRPGMPSFQQVLRAVSDAWRDRRSEVTDTAGRLTDALRESSRRAPSDDVVTDATVSRAVEHLTQIHDPNWGGFGPAPKFPQGPLLGFLLRVHARTGDSTALAAAVTTLDGMALGGMYDVIGGGFHRYSVDGVWLVPHFEKMLYDNALLAPVYLEAWAVTGDDHYRAVAAATLDYMVRELRLPGGGFASSQDADTGGVEGATFVWTPDQVRAALDPQDAEAAIEFYRVTAAGNFEGATILRPTGTDLAGRDRIDAALLAARQLRPQPGLDDKVIASWNGLALAALAQGAWRLERPDLLVVAEQLAEFLHTGMVDEHGEPVRTSRGGVAKIPAQLEDYAAVAFGLLELAVATADDRYRRRAAELADRAVELFADPVHGGFYSTAAAGEELVARRKELDDNPIPSGSSLLAHVLLRLARIDGDAERERLAMGAVGLAHEYVQRAPHGFGQLLQVVDLQLAPPREVAIIGDPADPATAALIAAARAGFHPTTVYAFGSGEASDEPLLAGKTLVAGQPAVYVCERFACQAPITDPARL